MLHLCDVNEVFLIRMKTLLVKHVSEIQIACDVALNQFYAFIYNIYSHSILFYPFMNVYVVTRKLVSTFLFRGYWNGPSQMRKVFHLWLKD